MRPSIRPCPIAPGGGWRRTAVTISARRKPYVLASIFTGGTICESNHFTANRYSGVDESHASGGSSRRAAHAWWRLRISFEEDDLAAVRSALLRLLAICANALGLFAT